MSPVLVSPSRFGVPAIPSWASFITGRGTALKAWYRLGESSATGGAIDSSGNGRTATYRTTNITYGIAGSVAGDSDTAVNVAALGSGANSYIAHATSGTYLNGLGKLTAVAAVKMSTGVTPTYLLTSFDSSTTANSRFFIDTSGGVARCSFYTSGGTAHPISGTTRVDDGAWHLVIGVWDGTNGTVDLYIGNLDGTVIHDGTNSVTAGSVIETPGTDRGVTIGSRSVGTNYAGGDNFNEDEAVLLAEAWSAADIASAVHAWAGV